MSLPSFQIPTSGDLPGFLEHSLGILFEPSPILKAKLVPNLGRTIQSSSSSPIESYGDLVDLSLYEMSSWSSSERASFISGHPRIGEVSNLSALSAAEQASKKTPPEVLERLEYLNSQYEVAYPGLRYITFVNGRSRAQIIPEIEGVLGLEDGKIREVVIHQEGSKEWTKELDRAIDDVGLIAKARLSAMGLQ